MEQSLPLIRLKSGGDGGGGWGDYSTGPEVDALSGQV